MRVTRRQAMAGVLGVCIGAVPVYAQDGVMLAEHIKPGDVFRYEIGLSVNGQMKLDKDGRTDTLPVTVKARHQLAERVTVPAENGAGQVLRHYSTAVSESVVGVEKTQRTLPADRSVIVAQRTAAETLHYALDGPLTRDHLDLVAEHFDTLCLPGLLPNKEMKVGETWPVGSGAAQAACLFHALIKHELVGKLLEVKDGVAIVAIEGGAEGIEHGAIVRVNVQARAKFDIASQRIVALSWHQADEREQGPINPALSMKAEVSITREVLKSIPAELNDETVAKIPADGKVPTSLVHLNYTDRTGRMEFLYPRDWHFVVRSNSHVVMRLVTGGELIAQATMTEWKKPQPGVEFTSAAREFKDATNKQPGWLAEKLLEEGIVPGDGQTKIFRLAALGKQDGEAVLQAFHLIVGPNGEQWVVTSIARQEVAEKIGAQDVALVNAIVFPKAR